MDKKRKKDPAVPPGVDPERLNWFVNTRKIEEQPTYSAPVAGEPPKPRVETDRSPNVRRAAYRDLLKDLVNTTNEARRKQLGMQMLRPDEALMKPKAPEQPAPPAPAPLMPEAPAPAQEAAPLPPAPAPMELPPEAPVMSAEVLPPPAPQMLPDDLGVGATPEMQQLAAMDQPIDTQAIIQQLAMRKILGGQNG
jgi:hypothetical protein